MALVPFLLKKNNIFFFLHYSFRYNYQLIYLTKPIIYEHVSFVNSFFKNNGTSSIMKDLYASFVARPHFTSRQKYYIILCNQMRGYLHPNKTRLGNF